MLRAKDAGSLHHFRRLSRQRLRAVARVASRPANSAQAARHVDPQALREYAQQYIDKYATPAAKARQHLYAAEEGVFNKLVITPDLDKRLARGDKDLQQACGAVESAVAAAIQQCYRKAPSDGLHATAADAGGEFGCIALGSGDQCIVDWDSESLWDQAAAASWDGLQDLDPASGDTRPHAVVGSAPDASVPSVSSSGGVHNTAQRTSPSGQAMDVTASAHMFLQRVLYKINRLNHFWYDDLSNYVNERSLWLARLQQTIEQPWQEWELQQLLASPDVASGLSGGSVEGYRALSTPQLKDALNTRYAADVDPPLSGAQQYVAADMDALGYCHLLAVGSVDGLVEASRQSRVCAGAANPVSCTIFRVLMEEYGTGRYSRKHSTFYKTMMEELGLDTREEAYLDLLPWQWLAASNQNFLITERRRHYLRYAGALSFFEINGPSVYKTYLAASRRNGLSEAASGYWELHVKEDERHGRQMLEEVALPLVDMYAKDAWELLLGYDQDRFMGTRAGAALVQDLQAAAALSRARCTWYFNLSDSRWQGEHSLRWNPQLRLK